MAKENKYIFIRISNLEKRKEDWENAGCKLNVMPTRNKPLSLSGLISRRKHKIEDQLNNLSEKSEKLLNEKLGDSDGAVITSSQDSYKSEGKRLIDVELLPFKIEKE